MLEISQKTQIIGAHKMHNIHAMNYLKLALYFSEKHNIKVVMNLADDVKNNEWLEVDKRSEELSHLVGEVKENGTPVAYIVSHGNTSNSTKDYMRGKGQREKYIPSLKKVICTVLIITPSHLIQLIPNPFIISGYAITGELTNTIDEVEYFDKVLPRLAKQINLEFAKSLTEEFHDGLFFSPLGSSKITLDPGLMGLLVAKQLLKNNAILLLKYSLVIRDFFIPAAAAVKYCQDQDGGGKYSLEASRYIDYNYSTCYLDYLKQKTTSTEDFTFGLDAKIYDKTRYYKPLISLLIPEFAERLYEFTRDIWLPAYELAMKARSKLEDGTAVSNSYYLYRSQRLISLGGCREEERRVLGIKEARNASSTSTVAGIVPPDFSTLKPKKF